MTKVVPQEPTMCEACGKGGFKGISPFIPEAQRIVWCTFHQRWECLAGCFPKG